MTRKDRFLRRGSRTEHIINTRGSGTSGKGTTLSRDPSISPEVCDYGGGVSAGLETLRDRKGASRGVRRHGWLTDQSWKHIYSRVTPRRKRRAREV